MLMRWTGLMSMALCICSSGGGAADEGSAHMKELIAAWRLRQSRVKSILVKFDEQINYSKGSLSDYWPKLTKLKNQTIPPSDVAFNSPVEFASDGSNLRFVLDDINWHFEQKQFVRRRTVKTLNGAICKDYQAIGYSPFPQCRITKGELFRAAASTRLAPLMLIYRPFDASTPYINLKDIQASGKIGEADGASCSIYTSTLPDRRRLELWVDRERAFLPIKIIITDEGSVSESLAISYSKDLKHGWVPKSWSHVLMGFPGENRVRETHKYAVRDISINIAMPTSLFDIDLPAGTYVVDERSGHAVHYITKPDGSIRRIPRNEWSVPYEQLLRSEPNQVQSSDHQSRRLWWATCSCLLILACTIGLLVSRKYIGRSPGGERVNAR